MRDDRYVLPVKHEFRQQVQLLFTTNRQQGHLIYWAFITFELEAEESPIPRGTEVERILTSLSLQVAEKDQIESLSSWKAGFCLGQRN